MNRRDWMGDVGGAAAAASLLTYVGAACSQGDTRKIRLAIAGGNFGLQFFFHEHPNCEVTAVTDLRADRRSRLQAVYGCNTAYPSLEELLKKETNVDAVALFTDGPLHVKHAKMCFERGLHVLSAVPACMNVEEANELVEAKAASGCRYMMAETSWYLPGTIYARNAFRAGKFGELNYIEGQYYHDKGDLDRLITNKATRFWNPDGTPSWRWGFPPMAYPTHSTAFITGVTDERVTHVSCLGWGTKHPYLTENVYGNPFWNECALMRTDKGHIARINVFWLVAGEGIYGAWYGDKSSLLDVGDGRSAPRLQIRDGRASTFAYPKYWESDMLPEPMRHQAGHGNAEVFISAEFINALLQNREPEVDLPRSLALTVPGIIAHQSALKNGEQLEVPQFG